MGKSTCKVCPAGNYCLYNSSTPTTCPAGSYCPAGTAYSNQFLCPNGTYSDTTGLQDVKNCTACTPGSYCGSPGLTAPTDVCEAGYFCGGGSSVKDPHDSGKSSYRVSYVGDTCVTALNTTLNDQCPPGHYCPAGSSAPVQCPPGTNSTSRGLGAESDCPLCTKGYYCPDGGTIYATHKCLAGYYCPDGIDSPSNYPNLRCPNGTMCPVGSARPVPCPAGSYQDEIGRSTCKTCPEGYLCDIGTVSPHIVCPVGRYCPAGSALGIFCANGTYGITTGLRNQQSCTPCPPSKYCVNGFVAGNCSAGYFCKFGQGSPVPYVNVSAFADNYALFTYLETINGGPCTPGHYCPRGTSIPISCPNKTVRAEPFGASVADCGVCPAGYTCQPGDPVPTPCERGKYCPVSSLPIECPIGTFNPFTQKSKLDECLNCPAGYFCNALGITNYNRWPCPAGSYCLVGATNPTLCPSGTYRAIVGGSNQSSCSVCPGGHYCPAGAAAYIGCPKGTYCPAGMRSFSFFLSFTKSAFPRLIKHDRLSNRLLLPGDNC